MERLSAHLHSRPEDRHYVTISGTPEGAARLRKELEALKTLNCKELGFSATPSGRVRLCAILCVASLTVGTQDLYHWSIRFFGFPLSTDLGQDLANHYQIHPPPARRWRPPPSEEEKAPAEPEIKQTEICLEMKFLPDYPNSAPLFRVISPHLNFADGTVMAAAIAHAVATAGEKEAMQVDSGNAVPAAAQKPAAAAPMPSPFLKPGESRNAKKKALSVSSHLEAHEEGWNADTCISDLLIRIRNKLQSGARVDLTSDVRLASDHCTVPLTYRAPRRTCRCPRWARTGDRTHATRWWRRRQRTSSAGR